MKVTDITLEGTPKVKMITEKQIVIDQIVINDSDAYTFVTEVIGAYYELQNKKSDREEAYKAIIEAVSEGIDIDILEDIEEEVKKLRAENEELRGYLEERDYE
ncbi:MAG: hypothetical protein GY787_27540 [Alteromonadales bacterium]|nr:hypothetical protein [Alteromonadales bacterium]